ELNVARRAAWLMPLLLALGGCATNRSVISLAVPAPATTVSGDKVAVIESVTDQRRFEEDPDEPSTPSLKKGDKYALDAEGRKSAIARKRNGYGHAIGDIVLAPPQTVETITRQLVAQGLQQHGYRVVDAAGAPDGALRVKVAIEEFWSWFTPGFWAVDMEARLRTLLQFAGASDKRVEISAYGKKSAPTGREGNYQQSYDRAFQDYLQKQDAALGQAGL
ncbi:MAG TPA: hypothetical protein VLM17_01180, partial [Xanthomonadaceae bacterium]|nr:hypothetical protein [Xanthomonadaceae bacterium]